MSCDEIQNYCNSSYLEVLHSKRGVSYVSPQLINSFLIMKQKFLSHCSDFLHSSDVYNIVLQLCHDAVSLDWLDCPKHSSTLREKLLHHVTETLLETVCKKANRQCRDKEKLDHQRAALRNQWRLRNAVLSQHFAFSGHGNVGSALGPHFQRERQDEDWDDVACYLLYMRDQDDPDDPPTQGNHLFHLSKWSVWIFLGS